MVLLVYEATWPGRMAVLQHEQATVDPKRGFLMLVQQQSTDRLKDYALPLPFEATSTQCVLAHDTLIHEMLHKSFINITSIGKSSPKI